MPHDGSSTVGKIFFHVIKTRESDTPYKNIFVKTMDIPQDQLEKMKTEKEESKKEQVNSSDLAAPVFETNNDIKPNHDMGVAFGDPKEEDHDDMPF